MNRQRLGTLLKLAVSAGIVALILSRVDLALVGRTASAIAPATFVAAFVISVVQNVLCVLRWDRVMRSLTRALRFWPALQANYVNVCLGQGLPSVVGGDPYRIYWLYQQGHAFGQAVRGVLIDRVSPFLALTVMLLLGLPWVIIRFDDAKVLAAVAGVLAAALLGTLVLFAGDRLPAAWRRVRALAELATLSTTARRVLLRASSGLPIMGLSLLVHVLSAVVVYLFARDLHLPIYAVDCLVIIPMVTLISALPISIAGWGVREGTMVAGLSVLGVRPEQALVLSILMGALPLANGLLGALPLAFGRVKLGEIKMPRGGDEVATS